MVSTDPPYYDNIGYAALSDFFYVWLRRTIGDLYRPLCDTVLVPKMPELTASPERFEGDKEKAKEHFESGFRRTFTHLRERLDPRFPLTVYYAFKQDDEESGGDGAESANGSVDLTTGWETLLDALISSGFTITATCPVRASQAWRMVSMGIERARVVHRPGLPSAHGRQAHGAGGVHRGVETRATGRPASSPAGQRRAGGLRAGGHRSRHGGLFPL